MSWSLPQTHFLETWGDARAFDGTISIQQPLILPFYGGKSNVEVLDMVLGNANSSGYNLVRNYWRSTVTGSFDDFWRETSSVAS